MTANPFRALPAVADVVAGLQASLAGVVSPEALTRIAQLEIERARQAIREGAALDRDDVLAAVKVAADTFARPRLEPILNASGVIVHTNLGRAPVSADTAAAMAAAAGSYVALELLAESNTRGGRMDEIAAMMRVLTGAEATLVVNNNAAAVLLTLAALSAGREAIVSRGEAIEIGGGFRIPDVMRQSGARLVEVGTTNRTYARDYAAAITAETAVLLKVHTSNFAITGFTASAGIEELASVVKGSDVALVEDLGSGALLDTGRFGLASEPTIGQRLAAGADLITASGDKLLGGPQAGIIAGRADLVRAIEAHPLARAARADKTCLAGLAATLRHYLRGDALERIPVWRMMAVPAGELERRGNELVSRLCAAGIDAATVVPALATVGGGALPGQTLPSAALDLDPGGETPDELARRLRMGRPRVFGRIGEDRLLLDLRSVLPEHDEQLAQAVIAAAGGRS